MGGRIGPEYAIESVTAQIQRKTQRVDRWRTGGQKQRWCAATLLHIEKNFRRVRGTAHSSLQFALKQQLEQISSAALAASHRHRSKFN